MKAAVFVKKQSIVYEEEYKDPRLRKDGIIIKVECCAICGSDLDAYKYETIPPPVVLGHEFSGFISEIGEKVEGWKIGDRVIVRPHIRCNKCYYCKNGLSNLCVNSGGIGMTQDGGFAEYVKVPLKNHDVFKIPNNIGFDYAALIETYAITHHALKLSQIGKNDIMVIIGAGAIGLFTLLRAKQLEVENVIIIEPNKYNQAKAKEIGADYVFNPDDFYEIKRLTKNIGADYVFECVGLPQTYIQAINLVRKAGTVILIGLYDKSFEFSFFPMMLKELTLKTITSTLAEDMQEIISILNEKKVNLDPFITKYIQLKDLNNAFKWLCSPEREAIKVMVKI